MTGSRVQLANRFSLAEDRSGYYRAPRRLFLWGKGCAHYEAQSISGRKE